MRELDKLTPQVFIEAVIVETARQTATELGIQWGGLSRRTASEMEDALICITPHILETKK